ncbi:MAG: hypothetical protein JXB05_33010 [Myxococcaceae bacterium]|nr:hypothetical protein [Myxococcaceae bacterium]
MVKFHPLFSANQVLTHEHLNDALAFLDREDHLSRTRLIGEGIVCGLEVRTDLKTKLVLGRGCGITSAGELLAVEVEALTYTHRRRYEDPAGYFAGRNFSFPVWELLESDQATQPGVALIADEPGFLEGRVALLYLEIQDKELRSCVENDCNERGRRRQYTQRLLVLSKEDASKLVLPETATFRPPAVPATLRVLRPIFGDRVEPFGRLDYADVVSSFLNSIQAVETPLGTALSVVIGRLQPVLGATALQRAVADTLRRAREAALSDKRGFQYLYDWFKDLTVAYTELVEVASLIGGRCCPEEDLFPRHLLLGLLEDTLAVGYRPGRVPPAPSIYRYRFMPSLAVGQQAELREQAASLLQRLILLLEKYSWVPATRIAITPDAGPHAPLERRTIPHYYSLTAGGPPSLLDHWSHYLTRHDWQRSAPSFWSSQYSTLGMVVEPLRYDHDGAAFFRVEGHIEQRVEAVLDTLDSQRRTLGLPFNIVAVALDDTVTDKLISKDCRSADLEAAYDELREEFRCALEHEKDFFESLMPPPSDRGKVKGVIQRGTNVPTTDQLYIKVLDTGEIFAAGGQGDFELELPEGPYVLQAFTNNFVGDNIFLDVRPSGELRQDLNVHKQILSQQGGISKDVTGVRTLAGASAPLSVEYPGTTKPPYRFEVPQKTIKEFIKDFVGVTPPKEAPARLDLQGLADVWNKAGKPNLVHEIGQPAQLALLLGQALTMLPGDLATLNLAALKSNITAMKSAATLLETHLLSIKTPLLPQQTRILHHVQALKAFCYLESVATLQGTLKERQEQQKKRLLFSEFLTEHPSLEHLGGVPRGGTFIIAYEDGVVKADFALSYLCCDPCGPMLLRLPDSMPPPEDIFLTLSFVSPTRTIVVPEATTGTHTIRSIVTNPGELANIQVEDPTAGKILIEGMAGLFALKEYSFEYLLQDNASGKTALGRVYLTLINDQPVPPPADMNIRTGSATAKLTIRPPAALPLNMVVASADISDVALGAVTVELAGEALGFQPAAAFLEKARADITYVLRNTDSQQTATGKVIVILEQQVPPIILEDVIKTINTRILTSYVINLPLDAEPQAVVERIDPLNSIYGVMKLSSSRGPVYYSPRSGIKAPQTVTLTYAVRNPQTGAKGIGRIILNFIWGLTMPIPELDPTKLPVIRPAPLPVEPISTPVLKPILEPIIEPVIKPGLAPSIELKAPAQPTPREPPTREAKTSTPSRPPPPKPPSPKGPAPKKRGKR